MKIQLIIFALFLVFANPLAAEDPKPVQAAESVDAPELHQTPDAVDVTDSAKTPEPVKAPILLTPKDEALIQSVWEGDLAKAELLVKKGANANAAEPKKARTVLMVAAAKGQLDIVKFLYGKGADINARDSDSQTALMYASRHRLNVTPDNAIAKFLIDNGAEVNVRSKKRGFTVLMLAASAGNVELVQQLLEKGADPEIADNFGVSALAMAQERGFSAVVDLLSNPPTPESEQ
ncbi:MAG: ankyrin repeat domain-containing protein [Gammaproteobacteria bacterium]|nr:ankyrin repeat domain-containing protein [Gammaproteobacteria bacterium]MDH5241625.1 ankyrin repeat domain-containing protein [Gammaproteobacteria bacterium]MDH5261548.1 ankyrin repeat domain-containing protein [Gammaproteobacteria bacterium]MDH5584573.1 ankyrin repeat domain-containing protein [Gammaproteobacteria bacterium]